MDARRGFVFAGTRVDVASDDPALLDWLVEFLSPAFDVTAAGTADCTVTVRSDPEPWRALAATRPHGELPTVACFLRDEKVTRRPMWRAEQRTIVAEDRLGALYVLDGRGVEVLCAPDAPRPRTAVMRVVRELATAPALADQRHVLLHAAAVVSEGRAVLFAGPRTCGKTTMLAYVAHAARAPIVANDRVLVTVDESAFDARGVPTIVSLRDGTFDLVPTLAARLPALAVPVEVLMAEAAALGRPCPPPAGDGRLKVSPAELAHALGTSLAAHAPLAAVVFPDPHGAAADVTVTRLDRKAARERLAGARFALRAPVGQSMIFAAAVSARPMGADELALDRIAMEIPCFTVHVGAVAFRTPDAAARVLAAVSR